jgi:hypothetical protein
MARQRLTFLTNWARMSRVPLKPGESSRPERRSRAGTGARGQQVEGRRTDPTQVQRQIQGGPGTPDTSNFVQVVRRLQGKRETKSRTTWGEPLRHNSQLSGSAHAAAQEQDLTTPRRGRIGSDKLATNCVYYVPLAKKRAQ